MENASRPTIGIIGAGKVGSTLAQLLFSRGYVITGVFSKTYDHACELAGKVNAKSVTSSREVMETSDLVLITVPDDAIEAVIHHLKVPDGKKVAVLHTSGVKSLDVFAELHARGVDYGSLHPAFPFADVATAMKGLPGATFGVESSSTHLLEWIQRIVNDLDGKMILLDRETKILYHAAMVIASNYVVSLYAMSKHILVSLGASETAAETALNGLLHATTHNILTIGTPLALTGPLTRQDLTTIQSHLNALHHFDPDVEVLYRKLAQATIPLLVERGIAVQDLTALIS